MDIILNQIALWRARGNKELTMRPSPAGARYRTPGGAVYQAAAKPLYRYAKDYAIGKVEFCLFFRTDVEDAKRAEAALDYYAKKISKEDALRVSANSTLDSFEYTPFVYDPAATLPKEEK